MSLEGFYLGDSEIAGVIAFGATSEGTIAPGRWVVLTVERGFVSRVESSHDSPPERLPTFEALGEIANPTLRTVLFVAAANPATWRSVAVGGAVDAIEHGTVTLDGDEGIFIRFMDRLLPLMQSAAATEQALGA